jgi:hypothetical protein
VVESASFAPEAGLGRVAKAGGKTGQISAMFAGLQIDSAAPGEIVSTTSELVIWAYNVSRFRVNKEISVGSAFELERILFQEIIRDLPNERPRPR